jgi:hypothetical protein
MPMVNTQQIQTRESDSHSNLRELQKGLWISSEAKFKVSFVKWDTMWKVNNVLDFPTSNRQSHKQVRESMKVTWNKVTRLLDS